MKPLSPTVLERSFPSKEAIDRVGCTLGKDTTIPFLPECHPWTLVRQFLYRRYILVIVNVVGLRTRLVAGYVFLSRMPQILMICCNVDGGRIGIGIFIRVHDISLRLVSSAWLGQFENWFKGMGSENKRSCTSWINICKRQGWCP